ncbi:hypothetical protein [Flavobacterium celericrescens]|uniref:Lipoprotein n=1 Tax=Flavobacterium celericrescens TaxID=2709780 RepID=A0ABX0IBG1_9FLAO|nr:hypothetical protein [Flavobacterium celericrescens]NHM03643.1 hypothetical protein [Flavobacterium celericrescens]
MKKQVLFYLLIFVLFSCKNEHKEEVLQKNQVIKLPPRQIKIDKNNLIGFACFYSGKKSEPVEKFTEILLKKDYSNIIKNLKAKNIADKYLATAICEKLSQKKLINLTEEELNQIKMNKNSSEKVSTCAGCTNNKTMTLKELLLEKNYISEETEEWLNKIIK